MSCGIQLLIFGIYDLVSARTATWLLADVACRA